MKRINLKGKLIDRLKIASYIFALIGWFMLIVVPLELFFNKDFSNLEELVETNIFKWGIKVFIIIMLIILIKGQKRIEKFIARHQWLKIALRVFLIVGAIGWIIGLGSLLL
jgi:hypothetical protein